MATAASTAITKDDAPRPRRLLLLGVVAALAAVSASRPALARRARVRFGVGAGLPGRGPYGPGVLGRDQLERCVLLEREINAEADALDAEEAALDARRTELERLRGEVEGRAAGVDRGDRPAVDRHNRAAARQRAAAEGFNARLPAFAMRAERHEARVRDFGAGCAGGARYYDADLRAVRARLLLD